MGGKSRGANNTKMHLQAGNSDWTLSYVGMPTLAVACVCVCFICLYEYVWSQMKYLLVIVYLQHIKLN